MDLCPVCAWEDAPEEVDWLPGPWTGSNDVNLRTAQRNFEAMGVVDERFLGLTRAPTPNEARPEGWRTIDRFFAEEVPRLIADIAQAFAHVTREGGISLHETIGVDGYRSNEECRALRALDTDTHWSEIPHSTLADVSGVGGIHFLDPIGWRYHLPAYLTWWLHGDRPLYCFAADALLSSLSPSPDVSEYCLERYRTLDATQVAVVRRFLELVVRCGERHEAHDARAGLERYWASAP